MTPDDDDAIVEPLSVRLNSAADRHLVILDGFLGGGALLLLLLLRTMIDGLLGAGASHRRGIIASNFSSTNLQKEDIDDMIAMT